MQIVFKVRENSVEQAEQVAKGVVRRLLPESAMADVSVRQLFPGLAAGQRARLYILELPERLSDQKINEVVESLRESDKLEYAEIPAAKRPV